eukprot:1173312-Amphidinium_carterae.1
MESLVDCVRIGLMVAEGGFMRVIVGGIEQYGLLSHDAAQMKFRQLCEAPDAVCDLDNPQSEIQVRIPVSKEVDYRDTSSKIKVAVSTRKSVKNPDEAQLSRLEETLRQDIEGVLSSKRKLLLIVRTNTAALEQTPNLGHDEEENNVLNAIVSALFPCDCDNAISSIGLRFGHGTRNMWLQSSSAVEPMCVARVQQKLLKTSAFEDGQLRMSGLRLQMEAAKAAEEEEKETACEEKDEKDTEGDAVSKGSRLKEKKQLQRWFDRDRAVTSTLRKE